MSKSNNYFKITALKKYVFFDHTSETSIYNAYSVALALSSGEKICMWDTPNIPGPWSSLRVIR